MAGSRVAQCPTGWQTTLGRQLARSDDSNRSANTISLWTCRSVNDDLWSGSFRSWAAFQTLLHAGTCCTTGRNLPIRLARRRTQGHPRPCKPEATGRVIKRHEQGRECESEGSQIRKRKWLIGDETVCREEVDLACRAARVWRSVWGSIKDSLARGGVRRCRWIQCC